jgi:nucleoside-triphosphatase THEP1
MTGREEEMEANDPSADDLLVGRFRFRKAAFDFAASCLKRASQDHKKFIVVDEAGPLELKGLGLHQAIEILLETAGHSQVILVVREGLVDAVVDHYDLRSVHIISMDQLGELNGQ